MLSSNHQEVKESEKVGHRDIHVLPPKTPSKYSEKGLGRDSYRRWLAGSQVKDASLNNHFMLLQGGREWGHPSKGLESKALYLESQHQVYESCNGGPDEREKEGKEQRLSEKKNHFHG